MFIFLPLLFGHSIHFVSSMNKRYTVSLKHLWEAGDSNYECVLDMYLLLVF